MLSEQEHVDEFTSFVEDVEPKLRLALCANFGKDLGREATADALAFAWEHWERIDEAANPQPRTNMSHSWRAVERQARSRSRRLIRRKRP